MPITKIKIGDYDPIDVHDSRIGSSITGTSTVISSESTNNQLPTAKAVNDAIDGVDSRLATVEDAFPASADEENQLVTEEDIANFITSSVSNEVLFW